MKKLITTLCLLAATATTACAGQNIDLSTPDGFAELDGDRTYSYRATNADGVVLAVRAEKNDPQGDLDFWSGAVDAHLRRAGYAVHSLHEVKSADGVDGKQLRYTMLRGQREHNFWVTVFVTGRRVVTVEAGGDHEFFDGRSASVAAAIESVKVGS